MKGFLKISYILFIACICSCSTTKKTEATAINNDKNDTSVINAQKMKDQGYLSGTISASKSTDCPYILTVEAYKDKLDPIDIQKFFKTEIPEKVWVKYSNLRMRNRCIDARPVSIIEVTKRTD